MIYVLLLAVGVWAAVVVPIVVVVHRELRTPRGERRPL